MCGDGTERDAFWNEIQIGWNFHSLCDWNTPPKYSAHEALSTIAFFTVTKQGRERREFACSATIYDCGGQFIKWGVEAPVPNPYMSILMFQFVTISCVEIICATKIQTNMNWSCRFHKFAHPHLSAKWGRKKCYAANAERIVIKEEGGMTSKRFLDKCGTYFFCHINMPLSKRQCWD